MSPTLPALWLALLAGCGDTSVIPADPCDDPGVVCRHVGRGDGINGFNGEGLLADQSMLYFPTALSQTPDGRLVVVDFNNMRIRVIEADRTVTDLAGNGIHAYGQPGPALDSPLENPIDVDFLPDGSFYIAELHAARILHVDTAGELTVVAGTGDAGYDGDGGLAVDAMMSEIAGVARADDGTIYIADTDNQVLRTVDPEGYIDTLPTTTDDGVALDHPERLRFAVDGTLLIADTGNHAIRRLDPHTGELTRIAGTYAPGYDGDGGPATEAALRNPTSAFEDEDGAIYIADGGNHVIRRIAPDGTIDTVAGTGQPGFTGDLGPALDATFDIPTDVRVGPDGALYVADLMNGAVRRIAR